MPPTPPDTQNRPTLAILGGVGHMGGSLALRWAAAGYKVIIGSRSEERARSAARRLADRLDGVAGAATPRGARNIVAARDGEVAILAVPYTAQAEVLAAVRPQLAGKVLISPVVPLRSPEVTTVRLPAAGSAAAEAQALLEEETRVVAAFQTVAAVKLAVLDADVDGDVLVCGDDDSAKLLALDLVAAAGLVGYDAGPLANSGVVEGLASILIGINRRYGARAAGVRITGAPPAPKLRQ